MLPKCLSSVEDLMYCFKTLSFYLYLVLVKKSKKNARQIYVFRVCCTCIWHINLTATDNFDTMAAVAN